MQPISLTYVYQHDFREGIRLSGGSRPAYRMNALIERSSRTYHETMERWVAIALEEGVRFFITSLGNPRWVVDAVHPHGGVVYHDVTEARWAAKAEAAGVDGFIAVNSRAGGHAGPRDARALFDELAPFGLPLVCAGGVGDPLAFRAMLDLGYDGVQCGTRFIATTECLASQPYKAAIIQQGADDIGSRTNHRVQWRSSGRPISTVG